MHDSVSSLIIIQEELKLKSVENIKRFKIPEIIAVSKTFKMNNILPLINYGHLHFGENKVQEAKEKWENIKSDFKNLKLHMIGKLQSNKVKQAVSLFDYTLIFSLQSVIKLDRVNIAVSSGTACGAGDVKPSPVLSAIGFIATSSRFDPMGLKHVHC